jgi:pyridoxine 4-dehydrogenase
MAEDLTVTRVGYGAMQLAGPHVFGPPEDRDAAIAVLREVVELGITHIDTSDYYGPYITNQLIREALHPYPEDLRIVTKVGALRDAKGGWPQANRADDELIDSLAPQGIAYVPYFPLGGFSTRQSDTLSSVAQRLGATPMAVALAWLLQRSENILLIPGTSSVAHLRENVAGAGLSIPDAELAELDAIAA